MKHRTQHTPCINNKSPWLALLCVSMVGLSTAQAADEETNYQAITVTAPEEQAPPEEQTRIDETTNTVWHVDAQDIQREMQGGSDLKGALGRLIPGMDFSSETSRSNAAQNIRGRPVLVLIDGVSMNSTRGISRQFDSINAFNIARVEVVSGATSIYGASARGGVINIITKKGDSFGAGGEASVGLISNLRDSESLSKKYAFAAFNGGDKFQLRASVSGDNMGGSFDADNHLINIDSLQTDTQFNRSRDGMVSALFRPTPDQAISMMYQNYNSEQHSPYGNYFGWGLYDLFGQNPESNAKVAPKKGLELKYPARTKRHLFNIQYNHNNFFEHKLSAQMYYRYESFRFFPFPSELDILMYEILRTKSITGGLGGFSFGSSEQNTEVYGANISLKKRINNLHLHYGLDVKRDEFFARQRFYDSLLISKSGGLKYKLDRTLQKYPHTLSEHAGMFLQSRYDLNDKFKFTAGFRTQYIGHHLDGHREVAQRYKDSFNPSKPPKDVNTQDMDEYSYVTLLNAGVNYQINPRSQTWVNFSQGLDLVPPARLKVSIYDNAKVSALHKDLLKKNPVVDSLEIGYRYSTPDWMTQIASYYSTSDKTYKLGQDFKIDIKDWDRYIWGVEGQVKHYFATDYSAGVQFHLNKSKMKTDEGDSGLYVYQATPNTLRFTVGRDTGNWGLNLSYNRLFSYNDDPDKKKVSGYNRDILPDPKIEGYSTVNLEGYFAIRQGDYGRIKFGINNLFNKSYETIWSSKSQDLYSPIIYTFPNSINLFKFKGPGRTFAVGYELEF